MARDYARPPNRSTAKPAARGKPRRGLPGWLGLLLGLSIGLVVAAVVWIERPAKTPVLPNTSAASNAAPAKDDPKKPIPLPPKQPSRFAFYEMLPSYEVVIPREDAAAAKAGKSTPAVQAVIAAPGQYLIQVGAYKTRDEAEKGRASLALLGVESKIEQVSIDQSETWYRVRIGPENDLAKAQEILQRLKANDIDGMLIKVKSG